MRCYCGGLARLALVATERTSADAKVKRKDAALYDGLPWLPVPAVPSSAMIQSTRMAGVWLRHARGCRRLASLGL
jgi:hypothetical protein